MNNEPTPPQRPAKPEQVKALLIGLLLGFVPIAIMAALGIFQRIDDSRLCAWAAVASIVCCTASSVMLFRTRNRVAIAAGILFLLLNLMISAALGAIAIMISQHLP